VGQNVSEARRVSRLRRHARLRKKIEGTAEVPRLMAGVAQLKVPLLAEVGVGPNWEQAH
jgi:DNA polymerase I-like protein with 3'-5' exonuclease and polymerase domains